MPRSAANRDDRTRAVAAHADHDVRVAAADETPGIESALRQTAALHASARTIDFPFRPALRIRSSGNPVGGITRGLDARGCSGKRDLRIGLPRLQGARNRQPRKQVGRPCRLLQ
jgi:hypothetical protein